MFYEIGKLTVVVQNNIFIPKSREVRTFWKRWTKQELLFLLPACCFSLNLIETQWHHLKTHDLKQIFNNEYDLAVKAIQRLKNRREIGNYQLERFIFNSA